MIMNKLKMNLALIALAFPLLLCAKTQRIEMDICIVSIEPQQNYLSR